MRPIAHVNRSLGDIIDQMDDAAMEAEADECSLSSGEQAEQRDEPLGSVNGKPESDDKENTEARSTDEVEAGRYAADALTPSGFRILNTYDRILTNTIVSLCLSLFVF